jgi:hypothetical protein
MASGLSRAKVLLRQKDFHAGDGKQFCRIFIESRSSIISFYPKYLLTGFLGNLSFFLQQSRHFYHFFNELFTERTTSVKKELRISKSVSNYCKNCFIRWCKHLFINTLTIN